MSKTAESLGNYNRGKTEEESLWLAGGDSKLNSDV